jgi:hypothetical protein
MVKRNGVGRLAVKLGANFTVSIERALRSSENTYVGVYVLPSKNVIRYINHLTIFHTRVTPRL